MKYQWHHASSDGENDTHAFWFNHRFMGWVTLPKEEMKVFIKTLKARYRKQGEVDNAKV